MDNVAPEAPEVPQVQIVGLDIGNVNYQLQKLNIAQAAMKKATREHDIKIKVRHEKILYIFLCFAFVRWLNSQGRGCRERSITTSDSNICWRTSLQFGKGW